MGKTEAETVKVTVNMPAALVRQAKHYAVDSGRTLGQVICDALVVHLKGKGAK